MSEKNELYYNLLLRRENLIKEGKQSFIEYVSIFGELLIKRYELLMEIAKLRKMISFCIRKQNYGDTIKQEELDEYIQIEMISYQNELNNLIKTKREVEGLGEISLYAEKRAKKLYYEIAKKLHPDLHPGISSEMIQLFNEAKEAYEDNDLETLERIYDYVSLLSDDEAIILDIDKKIDELNKEIEKILNSEPYTLKFHFTPIEVQMETIDSLKEEIESSKIVLQKLEDEFNEFEVVCEVM